MNIEKGTRVNVFSPEMNGKICRGTISTYEGKDQDGEARWSSWFARFVGKKAKKASKLEDGSRIVIENGKIENTYDKKAKKAWYTVTIFDWKVYDPEEEDEDEE